MARSDDDLSVMLRDLAAWLESAPASVSPEHTAHVRIVVERALANGGEFDRNEIQEELAIGRTTLTRLLGNDRNPLDPVEGEKLCTVARVVALFNEDRVGQPQRLAYAGSRTRPQRRRFSIDAAKPAAGTVASTGELCVLAIGAHPDDVEMGCGGTLQRMGDLGWRVAVCVLTDEAKQVELRRKEARAAAVALGGKDAGVHFLGFTDGHLVADPQTVGSLRRQLQEWHLQPSLVLCHSPADSHPDHRAAAELARQAFREIAVLCYRIPNSEEAEFMPRLFVDTTRFEQGKRAALAKHESQVEIGRIHWQRLEDLARENGRVLGTDAAESFELILQGSSSRNANTMRMLVALNDCPFSRFWTSLCGGRSLVVVRGEPATRTQAQQLRAHRVFLDQEGIDQLRRADRLLYGGGLVAGTASGNALLESEASSIECADLVGDIVLVGGAVSNRVTREIFNHFYGLRYVIDYDMPNHRRIRIADKESSKPIVAKYGTASGPTLVEDRGILTVMRNRMSSEERILVGAMGIHGGGSLAVLTVLSEREWLAKLATHMTIPFPDQVDGYQVIIRSDAKGGDIHIESETLHTIPCEPRPSHYLG